MIYDEYPFFWEPTGFRDPAQIEAWFAALATNGVSIEVQGERVYFRSLDHARYAAQWAQARLSD